MGKGGTKFVGDSLAARSGKVKGFSRKDRTKELEQFLKTGRHPVSGAHEGSLPQLPESRSTRTHVFFDYSVNGEKVGRVVVELYQDIVPAAAGHVLTQCVNGGSYQHTRVHKVLKGLALFGGKSKKQETMKFRVEPSLCHVDGCLLSVARDGLSYALTLTRALHLDETYQVVGRVVRGEEVVDEICSMSAKADDSPVRQVEVSNCGTTDKNGTVEFDSFKNKNEGAMNPGESLIEARKELQEALKVGIKTKRHQESEMASKPKKVKAIMALDDSSSSDDESDES